jgi:flagellar biosynthetic protein FliP
MGEVLRTLRAVLWPVSREEVKRAAIIAALSGLVGLLFPALALAQAAAGQAPGLSINLGTGAGLTDRVVQLVGLMTVLSLAPSIVIMTTSFVRIIVVLSLLRTALGLQQSPPNAVLVSLSLFLTAFIMAPTFQASYQAGIKPLLDHKMELPAAFNASAQPVKVFMLSQVNRDDLALFVRLSKAPKPKALTDLPLQVVTPAYMISELKRAFEIGFLLFVPFLVIDLVVASVLMSMGMMMLPPVVVSLPFKLIFFVLVDGWRLVAGSLVESFMHAPPG